MSAKKYITLVLCLLTCLYSQAQVFLSPSFSLKRDGDSLLQAHFSWRSGPNLKVAGWNYSELFDDTYSGILHFNTGKVGAPDLPTVSALVHLPAGSTLTVKDVKIDEYRWEGMVSPHMPLAPVIEAWSKDQGWPGYEPDKKVYSTDTFYRGGEPVEIEDLGVMGAEQLFRVTIRPVAYNPVSGDLLVDTLLTATLTSSLSPLSSPHSPARYLIVSRTEFREGLQPFVQWKQQEGYDVVELYTDTSNCYVVKTLMRPFFDNDNNPTPAFTLLVGDHEQLEAFPGTMALNGESHFTDLYYADFTGDYLPETLLGRWPVNDTAELYTVVEKTLRYEQFRDMDTAQLRRMLLVAGQEDSPPAPITTNGQVNYLKHEIKLAHPDIDTLCWYNPSSNDHGSDIIEAISLGASLLNYTAHCISDGWSHPRMTADSIAAAGTTQPTVYVNNCCESNTFTGTGFGERLLRMPVGGAVGVIGATNSTLWQEDYYWAVGPKYPLSSEPSYDSTAPGAFDGLVHQRRTTETLGELLCNGNMAVTAFGTGYAKYYWEIYCLLGDPSLKPWIGVPQPIDIHLTEGLHNGDFMVHIGGTAGTTVTLMQEGNLLGVATIDTFGMAVIELQQALDTLPVILTATGVDLQPQIDTLSVDAVEHGVTLRNVLVSDSTVHCIVENIGGMRYDSLRVELSQTAVQRSGDGALIEPQIVIIDSLLPQGRMEVTLPVTMEAFGQQLLWEARLTLWDHGDSIMCRLPVSHSIHVTYPTLTTNLTEYDGSEALKLFPNHDYNLKALVEGTFDSLVLTVTSYPDTDTLIDSHIQLPTSNSQFHTPDSLCSLHIASSLYYNGWTLHQDYWLEAGNRMEGFEQGFEGHLWDNNGRVPWVLDSMVSHSGAFSARSGAIDHSQITEMCLDVVLPHNDNIGFWLKTSSEQGRDRLTFFVDGSSQFPEWWGERAWQHFTFDLNAGEHRLCWRYSKDASESRGNDCVWIDDITLPMARWEESREWECLGTSLGIGDVPEDTPFALTVYPTPAIGQANLQARENMTVHIIDFMGRPVTTLTLNGGEVVTWKAPAGLYFATGSGTSGTGSIKIIIR